MAIVFESLSLEGMRATHLRQLLSYLETAEEEGWYYGNKEQFVKRHGELKQWLSGAVDYAISPGVVMPVKKKGESDAR